MSVAFGRLSYAADVLLPLGCGHSHNGSRFDGAQASKKGRQMRSIFGFLLAPFPTATVTAITVAVWPKLDRGGVFAHPESMFILICLVFYMLQAVFGTIGVIILRQRMIVSPRSYIGLGVLAITLPVSLIVLWGAIHKSLSAYAVFYDLLLFAVGGAGAGLIFWAVAVRHRPPAAS